MHATLRVSESPNRVSPHLTAERDILLPDGPTAPGEAEGLRIQLLGGFRVAVGSRAIEDSAWYLRKARSLLKLLALAPRYRLHREQITDVLWSEQDPEAATNNLHKALHVARRVLEPALPRNGNSAYLQLQHDFVSLTLPAASWIDVDAFEEAARIARAKQEPVGYEAALYLYTGDLLPEDRGEDWVVRRCEELGALHGSLWLELATLQEQQGTVHAAIGALRHVVANDPIHEEAHFRLMRLLVRAGQRHQALRQYQRLREALRRDLDAEPDLAIQAFYARLVRGNASSEPGGAALATPGFAVVSPDHNPDRPPLVGREVELDTIRQSLGALPAGQGGLLLVRGEAGVGKSRLVVEVREQAARVGVVTFWGRAYDHESHPPYSLFCTMLEGFVREMASAGRQTPVSDDAAKLSWLLRGTGAPLSPSMQALPFAATADFFNSLATHAPLMVVLDDLHLADPPSLDLLHHLIILASEIPLLILGAFQPRAGRPAGSSGTLEERLSRVGLAQYLDLPRLDFQSSALLIGALLGGAVEERVFERIFALAGGNPHYTEEAVRAMRGRGQLQETDGEWRLRIDTAILPGSTFLRRRGAR
jgi:DNA-binding SARP family transcriptional activator